MVVAWFLASGFLRLIDRCPLVRGVLYLYSWLSLDKVTGFSSNWTSYPALTAYQGGGLQPNILIWVGSTHIRLYLEIIVQLLIWSTRFKVAQILGSNVDLA